MKNKRRRRKTPKKTLSNEDFIRDPITMALAIVHPKQPTIPLECWRVLFYKADVSFDEIMEDIRSFDDAFKGVDLIPLIHAESGEVMKYAPYIVVIEGGIPANALHLVRRKLISIAKAEKRLIYIVSNAPIGVYDVMELAKRRIEEAESND